MTPPPRPPPHAVVARAGRSIALQVAGALAMVLMVVAAVASASEVGVRDRSAPAQPTDAAAGQLFWSLGTALAAGALASLAAVVVLTRRMVRPLAQALALQRRFVADASHELRAPLTVLHTRAQMLARQAAETGATGLADQAARLADDARTLGEVIDDLLDAAATAAPHSHLADVVDVAAVVAQVCQTMAPVAQLGGVTLVADATPQAPVRGSATALRRAVVALVDNALAHQHPGGTVRLRTARADDHVTIAVIDDGPGVDAIEADSMFARHVRGRHPPQDGARRSHGIGLALVREIARSHGGEVSLTETPGGGATFAMLLPRAGRPPGASRRWAGRTSRRRDSRRTGTACP